MLLIITRQQQIQRLQTPAAKLFARRACRVLKPLQCPAKFLNRIPVSGSYPTIPIISIRLRRLFLMYKVKQVGKPMAL